MRAVGKGDPLTDLEKRKIVRRGALHLDHLDHARAFVAGNVGRRAGQMVVAAPTVNVGEIESDRA